MRAHHRPSTTRTARTTESCCGATSLPRRLPELHFVAVRIEYPREAAVVVELRPLHDLDAVAPQLRQQRFQIVHAVVDHEARLARAEPLAVFVRHVPDRRA